MEVIKKQEAKRQLFHVGIGIFIVVILSLNVFPIWLFFLVTLTAVVIYTVWEKNANPIFEWFFKNFERRNESAGWGALWYCVGSFLTVVIFPRDIALAAILILAFGDSISTYIGRFYGKISHPFNKRKKIEGTVAGIFLATFGAWLFVPFFSAFITSFIVMNIEAIHWRKYDLNDNLLLPLLAGLILWLF
ncbi:MAG: hypothetical protein WC254_03280 [Candidatus Woesearchaeota archaeon]|jgi:dolichol kinase